MQDDALVPGLGMIRTYAEIDVHTSMAEGIRDLLNEAFPAVFDGRTYFKQWPHRRLVAIDNGQIVGQVGLDCRTIRVEDEVFGICGLIDLCVRSDHRRHGVGSALIREAERQARRGGLPFMVLMADRHDLYGRHGFVRVGPAMTKWLGIEDRRSVALIERDLSDCFMAKALTAQPWPKGQIDLLGYLF